MTQNKKHISPENITEWLASTGFLLPRNKVELERFEKLYGDIDYGLTGKEIDPNKILANDFKGKKSITMPESIKQRGFFEACLCPLVTFYQEGMDFHNSDDVQKVREWLKLEFNSQMVEIKGKVHRIAQSTKKKLNQGMLEKIVGYLEDNYAPPIEALDPEFYKDWRDRIYPYGGPDNIIDYLISLEILVKDDTTTQGS